MKLNKKQYHLLIVKLSLQEAEYQIKEGRFRCYCGDGKSEGSPQMLVQDFLGREMEQFLLLEFFRFPGQTCVPVNTFLSKFELLISKLERLGLIEFEDEPKQEVE